MVTSAANSRLGHRSSAPSTEHTSESTEHSSEVALATPAALPQQRAGGSRHAGLLVPHGRPCARSSRLERPAWGRSRRPRARDRGPTCEFASGAGARCCHRLMPCPRDRSWSSSLCRTLGQVVFSAELVGGVADVGGEGGPAVVVAKAACERPRCDGAATPDGPQSDPELAAD